jgi:hypothetical protein
MGISDETTQAILMLAETLILRIEQIAGHVIIVARESG